jgi:hypothetical protein
MGHFRMHNGLFHDLMRVIAGVGAFSRGNLWTAVDRDQIFAALPICSHASARHVGVSMILGV